MANKENIKLRVEVNHCLRNGMKPYKIAEKYGISRRMVTYYTRESESNSLEYLILKLLHSNDVENCSKAKLIKKITQIITKNVIKRYENMVKISSNDILLNKVRMVLSGEVSKAKAKKLFTESENAILLKDKAFMSKSKEIYNGKTSSYSNIEVIASIKKKLKQQKEGK